MVCRANLGRDGVRWQRGTLYSILVAFCVSTNERVQTTGRLFTEVNLSLICALTCALGQ